MSDLIFNYFSISKEADDNGEITKVIVGLKANKHKGVYLSLDMIDNYVEIDLRGHQMYTAHNSDDPNKVRIRFAKEG